MMSMAPKPGKILELLTDLDTDLQTRDSMDSQLERAVRRLPEVWPLIELAQVYVPSGRGLRLVTATDKRDSGPLAPVDTFDQALAAGRPLWDADRNLWAAPLRTEEQVFGLLAVRMQADVPEAEAWLQLLAGWLVRALARQQAEQSAHANRVMAEYLVMSSRLITTADSYQDMAEAAMYTLARQMSGVAITLFDVPLNDGILPGQRTLVAVSTPDGPITLTDPAKAAPDEATLQTLLSGQPVLVNRGDAAGFGLAAHYSPDPIQWLAAFGLRAGDSVLGTLEVFHTKPVTFTAEEIDAYTTLADQIGVSIRNHQLLAETTRSLEETRQLYELNRQMIGAQDTLELLQAIRSLAPQAVRITHLTPDYAAQGRIQEFYLNHVLTEHDDRVMHVSLGSVQGDESLTAHIAFWQQPHPDPIFIRDTAHPPADFPPVMAQAARKLGVASSVFLPIMERGSLCDIVHIGFGQPRAFDDRDHRLFSAVRDQLSIVFQTQRLLQEAQRSTVSLGRQVSVLQTLNDLSTVTSMAREESQLLNQTAQALVTALQIDYCQISMIDRLTQVATVVSEYPHRGGIGQRTESGIALVTTPPDARNPAPLVVHDVQADARITEHGRTVLTADKVMAFVLMPLFVRGQIIGSIRLDICRDNQLFTREMVEVAQTILSQVVIGLQNIRLLDDAQHRSEQLQRVTRFGQIVQSTLDIGIILETALAETRHILPAERMTIALHDRAADALRIVALYANGETYLTLTDGARAQLQGSPVGRVWETQRLLYIPDLLAESTVAVDEVRELRALLVMPLLGRHEPLGVVSVGHPQPNSYSDTDILVFQQLMGLLAAAVENASVYAQSERQVRNEVLVNEIATRLQQQVELDDMLRIAVHDLGQALGARRARIRLGDPPGVPGNGKESLR